jgi:hypothetical protein
MLAHPFGQAGPRTRAEGRIGQRPNERYASPQQHDGQNQGAAGHQAAAAKVPLAVALAVDTRKATIRLVRSIF